MTCVTLSGGKKYNNYNNYPSPLPRVMSHMVHMSHIASYFFIRLTTSFQDKLIGNTLDTLDPMDAIMP